MPLLYAPLLTGLALCAGFLLGRMDLRSYRRMTRQILLSDVDAINRAMIQTNTRLTNDLVRALSAMRADIMDIA